MTTKTGMSDHWKLKYLNRLNGLAFSAYDLISRDTRSEHEIETLLDAMQAFKLGKLRGVVRPIADDSTREEMFKVFSMRVEYARFAEETKKYLRRRGVRYIGEIFYITFDARSPHSVKISEALFSEMRNNFGLERHLSPLDMGWTPPYWDEQFSIDLDRPVLEIFGSYQVSLSVAVKRGVYHRDVPSRRTFARREHSVGFHYLGQLLRGISGRTPGVLEEQERILRAVNAPVWAAALVPKDWKAPEDVPAVWLEEQKKIKQETIEWQARKERDRQEQSLELPSATTDEHSLEQNLYRSIDEFELSVRASNAIKSLGILYVGQLVMHTETEFQKKQNPVGKYWIGRKTLIEIKEMLSSMGLSFGMLLRPEVQARLGVLIAINDGDQTSAP